MTVCVGAIAEKSILIGLSDRMLTAADGEIEFETEQVKAWQFSTAIMALVSGDMSIQSQVLAALDIEVKARIAKDPDTWVSVSKVAQTYCEILRKLRRQYAEEQILFPLGLDLPTFLASQTGMQVDFVNDIKNRLLEYEFPNPLETLFMGIDTEAPLDAKGNKQTCAHLFVTSYDHLSSLTTIGFAAIGIGKSHAESQFMFSGHWPQKSFDETLLLAYAAKKRAEAAPGVGKQTDIIVIGPAMGLITQIEQQHINELEAIYQASRKTTQKAIERAKKKTSEFVVRARQYYTLKREQVAAQKPKALTEENAGGGKDKVISP
jgi:hypothetical protein